MVAYLLSRDIFLILSVCVSCTAACEPARSLFINLESDSLMLEARTAVADSCLQYIIMLYLITHTRTHTYTHS